VPESGLASVLESVASLERLDLKANKEEEKREQSRQSARLHPIREEMVTGEETKDEPNPNSP
jgi:hypothetical protein